VTLTHDKSALGCHTLASNVLNRNQGHQHDACAHHVARADRVDRDGFRERGALGHLSFGGPTQVWPIWPFVWKTWKYGPLMCRAPQKSIFCCADFGSKIALDLQPNLQLVLHSSEEQMALQSFLRIYSSFV